MIPRNKILFCNYAFLKKGHMGAYSIVVGVGGLICKNDF